MLERFKKNRMGEKTKSETNKKKTNINGNKSQVER